MSEQEDQVDIEELNAWLKYTPEEVIGILANYFTEYTRTIRNFIEIIDHDEAVRLMKVTQFGKIVKVDLLTQIILAYLSQMERIIRVAKEYEKLYKPSELSKGSFDEKG